MKEYWQEATLNDICIIERGSSPRPIKKFITTGADGVNWIKIGDTKNINKYIFSTNQKITKEGALQSRYVKVGDFIISNSMSYGRPYILKTDGYIHDGWFVLRLDKKLIDENYLYYLLSSNFAISQYDELASGSIVKNINSDLIKQVKFLLPHLTEQKRIVKILDKAFEDIEKIKENAKQNLQNSRDLFQSYLNKLFTENTKSWQKTTLGEITDIIAGQSPESKYYNKEQKGLPFYQGKKEFTEKFIGPPFIWTTVITKESFKNDILLSVRAPVGPINYATEKCCIGRGLAAIRVKNNVTREFIFYYLLSIQKNISGHDGVVFPSINRDEICSLKLKIPIHLAEQKQIVKKLDILQEKTKKLEEIYNKKLQLAEELKQSILHKAFNGDL